jgi:hypothetical protein
VAVPTWARFMTAATRDVRNDWFQMPGSLTTVKLCRVSGLLATDRCHLPVVEPPPFDPNDDVLRAAVLPVVREGGVYEELRHVGRMPEPCPLPHGDVHLSDLQFDVVSTAIDSRPAIHATTRRNIAPEPDTARHASRSAQCPGHRAANACDSRVQHDPINSATKATWT